MHATVRSPLMTGVALVGAGAIAVSPLVVPPEKVHINVPRITSAAVELAANPLAAYGEAIAQALANAGPLVERLTGLVGPTLSPAFLAFLGETALENGTALAGLLNPATLAAWVTGIPGAVQTYVGVLQPFLESLIANAAAEVPLALQEALGLLTSGDFEGAVNRLLDIAIDVVGFAGVLLPLSATGTFLNALLPIPIAQDVINGVFNNSLTLLLGTGPLLNLPGAFGTGVQSVIDAVVAGDLLGAVNAMIAVPGVVIDGVLNGGYGPTMPFVGTLPGLLNPNGTIGGLLTIAQSILTNLGWSPPAALSASASTMAATDVPAEGAATFTLNVADTDSGVEAKSAVAETTTSDEPADAEEAAAATEPGPAEDAAAVSGDESSGDDDATTDEESEEESEDASDDASDDESAADDSAADDSVKDGNKAEPGTVANGPADNGADSGSSTADGDQAGDGSTDAGGTGSDGGSDSGGGEG